MDKFLPLWVQVTLVSIVGTVIGYRTIVRYRQDLPGYGLLLASIRMCLLLGVWLLFGIGERTMGWVALVMLLVSLYDRQPDNVLASPPEEKQDA